MPSASTADASPGIADASASDAEAPDTTAPIASASRSIPSGPRVVLDCSVHDCSDVPIELVVVPRQAAWTSTLVVEYVALGSDHPPVRTEIRVVPR
jgi:hypothetical protein